MSEGLSGPPYSGPVVKPILDSVKFPSDMKGLDMKELKQVRKEESLAYIHTYSLPAIDVYNMILLIF